MSAHKRNDEDIVDFVRSLNPRRERESRRRSPGRRPRRPDPGPAPRRWTIPLIAIAGVLFATGGGIALAASSTDDPTEVDCTLQVPANPLSAQGLATPYRLVTPSCHESDDGTSAFVQAAVLDPATGAVSVYNPVVVDQDSAPAAPPVVPRLPAGAVVGIWFGFNGDNLTLAGTDGSLSAGSCVNGLDDSIFGQYAYCDAPAFYTAANAAIAAGKLTVPPLGTAKDGEPCPTTRDFGIVDQDQSDNVTTSYLFLPDGGIAQNTAANQAALAPKGAKVEVNASDNGLLDSFVAPTLGCAPFQAPDLADPGRTVPALPLNELQAAAFQGAPVALVPTNDPMVLVDGKTSVRKTNLYRAGVNMGPIDTRVETPEAYCRNMVAIGVDRINLDRQLTLRVDSPDAGAANNLFTFLASRLSESFGELNCGDLLGTRDPVTVVTNADGVVVDARLTPTVPPSASPSATSPSMSPSTAPGGGTRPPASAPPSHPAPSHPAPSHPAPSASAPGGAAPSTSPTRGATTAPTHGATHAPTMAPAHAPTTPTPPPALAAPLAAGTSGGVGGRANGGSGGGTNGGGSTGGGSSGGGTNGGSSGGGSSGGGNGAGQAPVARPAGNTATASAPASAMPAGAGPAGAGPAGSAAPVPTLTLGPMPLKAKAAAGTGGADSTGGSMPPIKLAGMVLLSGGGVLIIGILIRGLINRRRRYRFAEL
ncbi:hypothetical protein GCM10023322_59770 [Rugosimonospora acidiphila]|uniref:Uncharacterized protein n=1 Tax=Rugosimonospora acidiphila TaxID=556531 RepID=A0ABP9SH32_9ACTN